MRLDLFCELDFFASRVFSLVGVFLQQVPRFFNCAIKYLEFSHRSVSQFSVPKIKQKTYNKKIAIFARNVNSYQFGLKVIKSGFKKLRSEK